VSGSKKKSQPKIKGSTFSRKSPVP